MHSKRTTAASSRQHRHSRPPCVSSDTRSKSSESAKTDSAASDSDNSVVLRGAGECRLRFERALEMAEIPCIRGVRNALKTCSTREQICSWVSVRPTELSETFGIRHFSTVSPLRVMCGLLRFCWVAYALHQGVPCWW